MYEGTKKSEPGRSRVATTQGENGQKRQQMEGSAQAAELIRRAGAAAPLAKSDRWRRNLDEEKLGTATSGFRGMVTKVNLVHIGLLSKVGHGEIVSLVEV